MTNKELHQRTVAIHTHGCKLNQADSQALARRFREAGYRVVAPSAPADVVVLNSCTVTATADAKARQYLRAARRRNPGAIVVATGCYAQRAPAELEGLAEVSLVIGNTGKAGLVESVQDVMEAQRPPSSYLLSFPRKREFTQPTQERPHPNPLPEGEGTVAGERSQHPHPNPPPQGDGIVAEGEGILRAGRTRAMVKIQEGCDQVCAYCIVPKVRGRERSIPPEAIIAEINRLASDKRGAEGFREVALTGTQLGTYGFDLPGVNLQRLLERILAETDVERVRVSSLQAHEITAPLLELWSDSRLMPHFHIPLQSGCDSTLKAMRRRYDTAQFAASVASVRRMYPDAGITTDIIVGFPGETAADFAASLDFAAAMQFSDIHAFPYSQRPGTSAAYFQDAGGRAGEAGANGGNAGIVGGVRVPVPGEPTGVGAPGAVGANFRQRQRMVGPHRQLSAGSRRQRFAPVQPNHQRSSDGIGRRLGAGRSDSVGTHRCAPLQAVQGILRLNQD